ncbi:hypothetical protein Tco_0058744 [Tanacetum coccineum]
MIAKGKAEEMLGRIEQQQEFLKETKNWRKTTGRMVLKGIAKVDIGPCDVGFYGKVMVLFDGAEVEVKGTMNSDLAGKLGFICFRVNSGVNRVMVLGAIVVLKPR